ncbi:peptidylprolyl isomerase [Kiloniella majae]|uniref:peptidylprolyl isomerase n=1 Tax=Kiloniella majae TaxID=1938558 RepID=UPI000A277758|nr:peptidylprolyl isomerase [Kiloniella majae]
MNFRNVIILFSLLIAAGFAQEVKAQQSIDDEWKKEQRESGGKLLKFLFGDDEEETPETDDVQKEKSTVTTTKTPTETTQDDVVIIPSSEENTPEANDDITQATPVEPAVSSPEEAPVVEVIPGQERDGLAPPPGFSEEVQQKPENSIVVEDLSTEPASQNTSSSDVKTQEDTPAASDEGNKLSLTKTEGELDRLARENPVVAVVEGDEIYWQDITQAAKKLPEQYQGQLETMFPILLDRAIDLKLLAHAGADADMDEKAEVKRKLALAEEKIIRDAYLEQQLDEMITESMLKDRYFALLRENVVNAEVRARHILVETRNEALALVIALDNGAEFHLLAKKFSKGPSAEKGGDLGWFKQKDMDPEFASAAFSLAPGTYTKAPVATDFGWHVIKLEDKRDVKQPTFESMRAEIKDQVSRELVTRMVRDLRKDADISVFPAN